MKNSTLPYRTRLPSTSLIQQYRFLVKLEGTRDQLKQRLSNERVFPIIIRSFLEILMRDVPLLNSLIYSKIYSIARYKKLTVVQMFEPVKDEVTTFLLDQICCQLDGSMGLSSKSVKIVASIVSTIFPTNIQKFLFDTLEFSLPYLVANQSRKGLDFISVSLDESVSVLCCREIQNILL